MIILRDFCAGMDCRLGRCIFMRVNRLVAAFIFLSIEILIDWNCQRRRHSIDWQINLCPVFMGLARNAFDCRARGLFMRRGADGVVAISTRLF